MLSGLVAAFRAVTSERAAARSTNVHISLRSGVDSSLSILGLSISWSSYEFFQQSCFVRFTLNIRPIRHNQPDIRLSLDYVASRVLPPNSRTFRCGCREQNTIAPRRHPDKRFKLYLGVLALKLLFNGD